MTLRLALISDIHGNVLALEAALVAIEKRNIDRIVVLGDLVLNGPRPVEAVDKVMALEAARFGIRVNALAPGYFFTDVSRILLESDKAPEFVQGIPMRRLGEFPDLDGPLLLLASDASSYMTGSVVVVDGGHICASL